MPDPEDQSAADEETIPETPLHGYKEGREGEVKGDTDALQSDDPDDMQQSTLEDEDEPDLPKH